MSKRRIALITGIALIIMAVIAGFSIGYAYSEFYKTEQLASLKDNIVQNEGLYISMLISIFIILILDLLVSYALYKFFENDNKKMSLISSMIRLIYTVVFGLATYYLTKNLNFVGLDNTMINSNFNQFQVTWNFGLVLFGFHIFLMGILMNLHKKIPNILCYLTYIAGVSYVLVHILKLVMPNSELVQNLEMTLALPMAIGELGFAIWLLLKGGK